MAGQQGCDAATLAALADGVARLVERLRGMALTRLGAPYAPEPTRADAGRAYAQRLADAAAACETPDGPVWRDLPRLSDAATGDLVAVCGHDLLAVVGAAPERVSTRHGGRLQPAALVAELTEAARELRLRL